MSGVFVIVFDATAKMPSGVTEGVVSSFGEYDQCLQIKSPTINITDQYIYGKYCLVKPYMPYPDFKELAQLKEIPFLSEQNNRLMMNELKPNLNLLKLLLTYNFLARKFYLFHIGVCIPSTCSAGDLHNVLHKSLYSS